MRMENLIKCFETAIMEKYRYVGVRIKMSEFEEYEVIINPRANFEKKLDYYKNAYNDNLTLKNAPNKIQIVGFTFGNTCKNISDDLLGCEIVTNGDTIRNMTNDELASFIYESIEETEWDKDGGNNNYEDNWLAWLNEEVSK